MQEAFTDLTNLDAPIQCSTHTTDFSIALTATVILHLFMELFNYTRLYNQC